MPPKRKSTRAATLQSKPSATAKSAKRLVSPPQAPPSKRIATHTRKKVLPAGSPEDRPLKRIRVSSRVIVPLNPLSSPPEHIRPPLQPFAWGANDFGQLGLGGVYPEGAKKPKKNIWAEKKIAEGVFGEVGAGLESVATGGLHSLFIDETGTVWSCGVNDGGALGRATITIPDPNGGSQYIEADEITKDPVSLLAPISSLRDEGFRSVKIVAGDSISVAISDKGELRLWGTFRTDDGALGFSGKASCQVKPTAVLELKNEQFVNAAAGNNHVLLLTTLGHIYTLGNGTDGQLGRRVVERRKINGTAPSRVVLGTRARRAVLVGAGGRTSFAVDEDGTTWGWGMNSVGQTGTGFDNPELDKSVLAPKKVVGLSKSELGEATVVEIAGGDFHTLFLTSDGRVYSCGLSKCGRLGLPDDHEAFTDKRDNDTIPHPVLITFPDPSDPVVHISVGTSSNLVVTKAGAIYGWGQQTSGELGLDHEEDVKTPTVVLSKDHATFSAVSLSCGGQHVQALLRKKV